MTGTDADPVRVGSDGGHGGDAKSKAAAPASDQPTAAQSTEDYQGGASGGTNLGVSPPPTRGAGAMFGMPLAATISVVYWGGIVISVIHFILCAVLYSVSRHGWTTEEHTYFHRSMYGHSSYETRSENVLYFLVNTDSQFHAAAIYLNAFVECAIIFTFICDLLLCCKYSQMSSSPYQVPYVDHCALTWYCASAVIYVIITGSFAVVFACLLGEMDAIKDVKMLAAYKLIYGNKYINVGWALMVFSFIFVILRAASIFAVCQFKKAADSAHRAAMMSTPMHPMGGAVVYGGAGAAGGTTVVVGGPAYGPYGGVGTPYGNAYGPRYY